MSYPRLLESDQKLVDALPADIREKAEAFCLEFLLQTSIAWDLRDQPLPDNYRPQMVDVYVDGSEDSCLYVFEGNLRFVDKSFFGDRHKATIAVLIDDTPRFVQIHGEVVADSLGGCLLPEILFPSTAQVKFLSQLMNQ